MDYSRVFKPDSVAIIGASRDETKRGFRAVSTLLEERYEGAVYPINPREKRILGLKTYPSVLAVKEKIDLALITLPADKVLNAVYECGEKGVAGVIIIAGGFGESGHQGKSREAEIVEAAKKYGMRIIGPNTSGFINVGINLDLVGIKDVPKGRIALLTQSGNIALHMITEAKLKSMSGFSYYVGVGNEADLQFYEYLRYFADDPETNTILMYVEGLRNGREFLKQAYNTTLKKPVVMLKSGRSSSGKMAAGSHTGSLAGISEVARNAFRRVGIINIEKSEELFPVAESLSSLPPIKNNNVAILADGGGHATISADTLTDLGVNIPVLSPETQKKLKAILPNNANVSNPVDVAGGTDSDPGVFAECAKILITDPNVGGVLIAGLFGGYGIRFAEKLKFAEEDAAHRMGKMVEKYKKPIVLQSLYNFARPHSLDLLRYYGIPVYDSLDIACKVISSLSAYGIYLDSYHKKTNFVMKWGAKARKRGEKIIEKAYLDSRNLLLEHEAKSLLKEHKIVMKPEKVAKSADEAVNFAKDKPSGVVLKIVSPDILHKSDAGGVKLNLKTEEEIRKAFDQIIENAKNFTFEPDIRGVLVSEMVKPGTEVIIGTKIDDQFGPVIMFGIGGILVEVVKDVSFRVLPIQKYEAGKMISEIKSSPILDGVRGQPQVDKKALINLLVTVSDIVEAYPQIKEMDLNPVILREDGFDIVDARILLNEPEKNYKK
ncbi:MAG: acetate--CoA ligase family protein [Desulfobacteraceae bacterium]|jgi:acetyltransferase